VIITVIAVAVADGSVPPEQRFCADGMHPCFRVSTRF
jgi:hypothetical protein